MSRRRPWRARWRWVAAVAAAPFVLLLILFAAGVLWPSPALEPVRTDTPLAFTGVTVVDVERGGLEREQTVIVEAGVITQVGPGVSTSIPTGARVVDGRGRYLVPGLWDMHAHLYAISPLLDLPLFIAYGVTQVRDMLSCPKAGDPFIACPEEKRRWNDEAVAGQRIGPRVVSTTSFMANGSGTLERLRGVPRFFGTSTPEEARAFVRHFAGRVDEIKVYDRIPRDAYLALVDEARRHGLPVVGHRPHAVGAAEAAAHQKSIEHARFILHESFPGRDALREAAGTAAWREDRRRMLDEHDPAAAAAIFEAMRRHGTWYVPTHLTRWSDAYADDPAVREDSLLRYLHPLMRWQWMEDVDALLARDPSPEAREAYREFYRRGLALTGAAHAAGVRVLAGSDYLVSGPDLHRELEQLVLAGLSPAEALRAATLSAAEYYGLEDRYGRIAPGFAADLVLLAADPLEDIRHTRRIEAVVFNGNLYDRAALDAISAHVRRQARSWAVGSKIIWRFIRSPASY
jgi:imidazolonepropionase-like amidohydrolase